MLVFGGSLGARSINTAAADRRSPTRPTASSTSPARATSPTLTAPGPHYVLLDYLTPFGIALAAADVAVARSGGSVFELAQYGLPAVLIPYPHASADHQTPTPAGWPSAAPRVILPDAELTPERLRAETDAVLERREAMSAAALATARAGRRAATSPTRSSPRLQAKKFIPPSEGGSK